MKALASDLSVSDLEQQLGLGATFATKDECQKCVLGLFLKRGEAALYKVRRSEPARVELGCVNKECENVRARVVQEKGGSLGGEGEHFATHMRPIRTARAQEGNQSGAHSILRSGG